MRKGRLLVCSAAAAIHLSGCGSEVELPQNPIVYEMNVNEEEGCSYLVEGNNIFIPYCAYSEGYLGDCIGYCDIPADEYTEASRIYIFELKGFSSSEWIVETLSLNNCNEGMIWREVNATDIPDGLESEYEWNL